VPGLLSRSRRTLAARYRGVAGHPAFAKALIAFFVAEVVVKLIHVGIVVSGAEPGIVSRLALMNREIEGYSVVEWLQLGSSLLSAGLVGLGVALIRQSRLRGLRMFQRAILVSIFLTQVFMFYHAQWMGLIVLAFNLLVLLALDFMIEREAGADTR
jgi:hypothetical protein